MVWLCPYRHAGRQSLLVIKFTRTGKFDRRRHMFWSDWYKGKILFRLKTANDVAYFVVRDTIAVSIILLCIAKRITYLEIKARQLCK